LLLPGSVGCFQFYLSGGLDQRQQFRVQTGREFLSTFRGDGIGTPSDIRAVDSSVPSLDGDAPRYSFPASLRLSALKVYCTLCSP